MRYSKTRIFGKFPAKSLVAAFFFEKTSEHRQTPCNNYLPVFNGLPYEFTFCVMKKMCHESQISLKRLGAAQKKLISYFKECKLPLHFIFYHVKITSRSWNPFI